MTTKQKLIIAGISIAVIVGIVLGIKFLPVWATLGMIGTFIVGTLFGYVLKKAKKIEIPVEVIKEVPVEVIKEVIKEVPVEVIKYVEAAPKVDGADLDIEDLKVVDAPKLSKSKKKKAVKAGTTSNK